MGVWLTEVEFRQSGGAAVGVTLNLAFFQEIKDDHIELRELVAQNQVRLSDTAPDPSEVVDWLHELRDELETYFALEEFYGYFNHSAVSNPHVSQAAIGLQREHEELFVDLVNIIEATEQIIYRETDASVDEVVRAFDQFCRRFELHEQAEMELMMRFCNEEIGGGG